jgi:hypothetical protein
MPTVHVIQDCDVRIIALDANDVEHASADLGGGRRYIDGSMTVSHRTAEFDLPLDDIAQISVQKRPYTRIEFNNVSLRPGQKRKIEIVTREPWRSKSKPSEGSDEHGDLTGKWAWTQGLPAPQPSDLFRGEFVLEKDGDSYTGALDDISEGTYGDTIKDVTVVEDQISFTRQGQWGLQQWKGTLKTENGKLTIVDGQWTKGGIAGIWSAHKID